jgi:hypothetical protein
MTDTPRPVAVVAACFEHALVHLRAKPNLAWITHPTRSAATDDGTRYVIVTRIEHARGMEFARAEFADGPVDDLEAWLDLRDYVQTRIRETAPVVVTVAPGWLNPDGSPRRTVIATAPPQCPGCQRYMSQREAREQGCCNRCAGDER